MTILLRPWQPSDTAEILRLNSESVAVLSPMDQARFKKIRDEASLVQVATRADTLVGFLIGFTKGANYDSPNYQWFTDNVESFLYVDRVVIDSRERKSGIGGQFYQFVRTWAESCSLQRITAEIDIEPANEPSLLFHKKQGFVELERQKVGAGKVVSLQSLSLEL